MRKNNYKYTSDKELFADIFLEFDNHFKPFFKSFKAEKKTFCVQCVNLILTFCLFSILLDGVTSFLISNSKNSSLIGTKIVLYLLLMIVITAWKKNKVFNWHTIFEIDWKYSIKHFKRLFFINGFVYGAKEIKEYYGRKN